MGIRSLDRQDLEVYIWLYQQVEQFRRTSGAMAIKDFDTFEKAFAEVLQGLSPEIQKQILSSFTLEQRLEGLKPEEMLRGLSPEQREQLKRLLH
jgi:hypothetical protein